MFYLTANKGLQWAGVMHKGGQTGEEMIQGPGSGGTGAVGTAPEEG